MDEHGLLQQSLTYLAAAVLSVPIARKLGLGSVLGYLIAGVLIGPHVFELVGKDPKDQSEVMHFAEFGVVMMLFLVGLELRPARLWQMRVSILGLGGLQVGLSILILAMAGRALGLTTNEAIAVGMILSLSSTAIVLQSLTERGLLKTSPGQSSFSVLLFQDIAVIPMLAVLPFLAAPGVEGAAGEHAGASLEPYQQALYLLIIVIGMVLGGRFLARPAFRFIAAARLPEVFTAAALLLVVALAYLMQLVGVSPALGAFLGGVILAESEFRHELESNIEPFKGLLLGLFFIAVGASMDLALLVQEWRAIALLTSLLLLIKFFVLYVLGRGFRMQAMNNLLFAVALCQAGEFAFVLFASVRSYGVLQPELIDLLTLVVAVSMIVTPLLMIGYASYAKNWSIRNAVDDPDEEIETQDNPVIIAGYGRFGQIVGRLLHANGFGVTLLDHDPGQIEMTRRFGFTVYYGDATRMDLLHTAGAEEAKILVVAIDGRDEVLTVVREAKKHFPHLKILTRAIDRQHAYELMALGCAVVRRETFSSALEMGNEALQALGYGASRAAHASEVFRAHDEQTLTDLFELWSQDRDNYVIEARAKREELRKLMAADDRDADTIRDESPNLPET
ncbi:MAG: monovalent cation:proton antiporter-2 (CPA2) family protein [Gammaproteobacteria bacterium]